MISFDEAYQRVLNQARLVPPEAVDLSRVVGRVLAEEVHTDRPYPPYDRATHDGIVISRGAVEYAIDRWRIVGTIAAGAAPPPLTVDTDCREIMTGAMVPPEAGAVIRYEDVVIENGYATVSVTPTPGQMIEPSGSQRAAGEIVMQPPKRIDAADVAALATVGKSSVAVRKLPRVAVLSTGDELVAVDVAPEPYQIRWSNGYMLRAALQREGIAATVDHLLDHPPTLERRMQALLASHDVLLLSGGVSRGKYDFLPEILGQLGTRRIFHRIAQKPGKPFWFGQHPEANTTVFSFPGNPVSTEACYTAYFRPWLYATLGLPSPTSEAVLSEDFTNDTSLTRLVPVRLTEQRGTRYAQPVAIRSSGDLFSLVDSDGLIVVPPVTLRRAGAVVTVVGI